MSDWYLRVRNIMEMKYSILILLLLLFGISCNERSLCDECKNSSIELLSCNCSEVEEEIFANPLQAIECSKVNTSLLLFTSQAIFRIMTSVKTIYIRLSIE